MTIRNPFSGDGSFSAGEKLAAFERELIRSKAYHQGLVDAGRMKRENFASKIGALEAIADDLRAQMIAEAAETCQWIEPADSAGILTCSTCGSSYAIRGEARPACPRGIPA